MSVALVSSHAHPRGWWSGSDQALAEWVGASARPRAPDAIVRMPDELTNGCFERGSGGFKLVTDFRAWTPYLRDTGNMPGLRDIVYLDRVRVDSFVSQLRGGLVIEEDTGNTLEEGMDANFSAGGLGVKIGVGAKKGRATSYSTTRIPAYAILELVEEALEEANLLGTQSGGVLPGRIVRVKGEMTLESWGLLASLADNLQGAGTLGAKIYASTRGQQTYKELHKELGALEKWLKRKPAEDFAISSDELAERQHALAKRLATLNAFWSVLTDGYLDDVKEIVKLFFQDQHHIRIETETDTLVGPLRPDGLVGSTMEELSFAYGARPSTGFTMLALVTEFSRADEVNFEDLIARFVALKTSGQKPGLGLIQRAIRELGGALLEIAEELRRPTGEEIAFVIPLALYREVLPGLPVALK